TAVDQPESAATGPLTQARILFAHDLFGKPLHTFPDHALVAERAAVLARIGAAGQRALVPIDPDRLPAAERSNQARGLVAELLQAFNGRSRHAVLELIDALVMQAARHIDRFLHVAAIVEDVGQHTGLSDRLILPAHHAVRHHCTAALG